jgi:hypothetical protein
MTKKLSELFELPLDSEDEDLTSPISEIGDEITTTAYTNLERIEAALPHVRGLELADVELDELAQLAKESFNDLSDLGMQVDSRFASEIFNAASSMLGHAITAKTAKINKKLKMIDLQLKKAALDHKMTEKTKEIEATPLGEGKVLDRNELLKTLLGNKNDNNDK